MLAVHLPGEPPLPVPRPPPPGPALLPPPPRGVRAPGGLRPLQVSAQTKGKKQCMGRMRAVLPGPGTDLSAG